MDIKVALKNALGTIQTPTTAANYQATDLVPLFDSNDQLIGKISRNELMSAVKTSLGTLLNQGAADLGTSLAKIPALNSGGTLGSATVANLASVLGGRYVDYTTTSVDLNTLTTPNKYVLASANTNAPSADYALLIVEKRNAVVYQWFYGISNNKAYYRHTNAASVWQDWHESAFDVPEFYKNYNDLGSLASAMGIYRFTISNNSYKTIDVGYGIINVTSTGSGINAIYSLNSNAATRIGGDANMDSRVTITKLGEYQTKIQDIGGSGLTVVVLASK